MFSPEGEDKQKEVPEADAENGSIVASNPTDRENLLKSLNIEGYKVCYPSNIFFVIIIKNTIFFL